MFNQKCRLSAQKPAISIGMQLHSSIPSKWFTIAFAWLIALCVTAHAQEVQPTSEANSRLDPIEKLDLLLSRIEVKVSRHVCTLPELQKELSDWDESEDPEIVMAKMA